MCVLDRVWRGIWFSVHKRVQCAIEGSFNGGLNIPFHPLRYFKVTKCSYTVSVSLICEPCDKP